MMKWDETTGRASVFRFPSNYSNGNTRDRQGRLVTCEHGTRRVTRTEYDGTITVLVDKFDGKPLNSPNDVVVKSDGSIWFTDPPPGIAGNYEGQSRGAGIADQRLPARSEDRPRDRRGRRFHPAERHSASRRTSARSTSSTCAPTLPRVIRVYDVVDDGTKLANPRAFVTGERDETPDGFRCDVDGNLWCGWGTAPALDGVMVFNRRTASGSARSRCPSVCANLCFGGVKRNRLFMAASHSLYALYVSTQGVQFV